MSVTVSFFIPRDSLPEGADRFYLVLAYPKDKIPLKSKENLLAAKVKINADEKTYFTVLYRLDGHWKKRKKVHPFPYDEKEKMSYVRNIDHFNELMNRVRASLPGRRAGTVAVGPHRRAEEQNVRGDAGNGVSAKRASSVLDGGVRTSAERKKRRRKMEADVEEKSVDEAPKKKKKKRRKREADVEEKSVDEVPKKKKKKRKKREADVEEKSVDEVPKKERKREADVVEKSVDEVPEEREKVAPAAEETQDRENEVIFPGVLESAMKALDVSRGPVDESRAERNRLILNELRVMEKSIHNLISIFEKYE